MVSDLSLQKGLRAGTEFRSVSYQSLCVGKGQCADHRQAAGFFNMLAEGMSCALHSGAIAGESIVEAMQRNRPVQEVYRTLIASEVRRCTDQWNRFR